MQSGVVVVTEVVDVVVSMHVPQSTGQRLPTNEMGVHTFRACSGVMNPHSSSGSGLPLHTGVVVVMVVDDKVVVVIDTVVVVVVVEELTVVVVVVVVLVVVVVEMVVVVVSVCVVVVVLVPVVVVPVVVVEMEVVVVAVPVVEVVVVVVTVVVDDVHCPHFAGQSTRRFIPLMPGSSQTISGTSEHDIGS